MLWPKSLHARICKNSSGEVRGFLVLFQIVGKKLDLFCKKKSWKQSISRGNTIWETLIHTSETWQWFGNDVKPFFQRAALGRSVLANLVFTTFVCSTRGRKSRGLIPVQSAVFWFVLGATWCGLKVVKQTSVVSTSVFEAQHRRADV